MKQQQRSERGTILVVVLFIATAIGALAALSSSRVVTETRQQKVLEDESHALTDAYAQLQMAMNVVNTSAYTDENRNIQLLEAMAGDYGGTAGGDPESTEAWLRDPSGILHGKIDGTDVRCYTGRDYIQRLAFLKGETPTEVDPTGTSQSYYVLESAGRHGDTIRVVSALVRENEPFSSFVFFQNRHPLGISGAPRGLIHANDKVEFYFPNGNYVDSVSAVNGFGYEAGATPGNTNVANGNPEAESINLEAVDFDALKAKASTFVGTPGLDAEIRFLANGQVQIREYTPPRFEDVEYSWTGDVLVGWTTEQVPETQSVQVGTTQEERTRTIITGYDTVTYYVDVPVYEDQIVTHSREDPVYEDQIVTRSREDPVYEDQQVEKSRQVAVYELQMVTKTRWVEVFVPYDDGTDAGGGTAIGGDGGVAGEYRWVQEEYQVEENVLIRYDTEIYYETQSVQVGTTTVTWQETEQVQVGTTTVTWDETESVQVGTMQEERTRDDPIYGTETYYVDVPVYEDQEVMVDQDVPVYETQTYTWTETEFFPPTFQGETNINLGDAANTIYIDGRVTRLYGDVHGRVTLIANEKVRVTGSLRYVDDQNDPAMLNGGDYSEPYQRNEAYNGDSVLGVIARDDVLFTRDMPYSSEINATLMSSTGRVGIDGFAITEAGEPTEDWRLGLTAAEKLKEDAYQWTNYKTRRFVKD
jgi:type II secretory pathway pseudopilin PulG